MPPERRFSLRRRLRQAGDVLRGLDSGRISVSGRLPAGGLRLLQMVWRGFRDDECRLHASALTYYSLMSLAPVLALALALARFVGGEQMARAQLTARIAAWSEQLVAAGAAAGAAESEMAADFARRLTRYADLLFDQIGRISFGTLGVIGLAALVWTAVNMLAQVERSFNRVWSAPPRPLWRRFAVYLGVLLIVPFLALAASSVPLAGFLARHFGGLFAGLPSAHGFARFLQQALGRVLAAAVFVFVLVFMPNTRVRFKAGLAGGVATAVLLAGWLRLCAALQIGVAKYSRLYGSFAALPIVLAWTYVSWQIVLVGAELAFAVQNADVRGRAADDGLAGGERRVRQRLALAVAVEAARAMAGGAAPFVPAVFARERRVAAGLLNGVLEDLRRAGLLVETPGPPRGYVLARDPARLAAREVVAAVVPGGISAAGKPGGGGAADPALLDPAGPAEADWRAALDRPVAASVPPNRSFP